MDDKLEGAPETTVLRWREGQECFTQSPYVKATEVTYTRKDISDKRISWLEDELSGNDTALVKLTAQLATARNEALEEAAVVCDKRASLAKSITDDMQQYNTLTSAARDIRALKADTT